MALKQVTNSTASMVEQVVAGSGNLTQVVTAEVSLIKGAADGATAQEIAIHGLQVAQAFAELVSQGFKNGSLTKQLIGGAGAALSLDSYVKNLNLAEKEIEKFWGHNTEL